MQKRRKHHRELSGGGDKACSYCRGKKKEKGKSEGGKRKLGKKGEPRGRGGTA